MRAFACNVVIVDAMRLFKHEHVFRAPSTAAVFTAYFDPRHASEMDRELDIVERVVLESQETSEQYRRVCRVVPRRQLPALVRPLCGSQLSYTETAIWTKREDVIDIVIQPSILSGRATIRATYRLSRLGAGMIRRTYEGAVSVDVALFASRIERGIAEEFERSIPVAAACTQAFLDRHAPSLSAHA